MRNAICAALLISTGSFVGCGESYKAAPPEMTTGPHQGTAYRLPSEKGFAEIVNEPPVSGRDRTQKTSIVVYFLQSDGKTALADVPADVGVQLDVDRKTIKLAMAAEPKSDDPSGGCRFVSKPGPYDLASIRGRMTATIGSEKVEKVFAAGR